MPILYTNSDSDHSMGNKDKTRDGDAAAENRDSRANRDHSRDRESRDATLARTIAEAVALQTQEAADQGCSKGDPVYGPSIYKANGEGSCTISGLIEGKSHCHLTNYP